MHRSHATGSQVLDGAEAGAGSVARTSDILDQIGGALRDLAPRSVVSGVRRVDKSDELGLFPEELAAIRRAARSRRQQFATGRALLRQLIECQVAIPVGRDRRPVLPIGVVASLAHDDTVAVAVVSTDPRVTALGVDIEPIAGITPDLAANILRQDDGVTDPAMAFVVKEAAYKAWSGPDRPIIDHHDVRIGTRADGGIVATVLPTGERVPVNAAIEAGRWLAVAVQHIED